MIPESQKQKKTLSFRLLSIHILIRSLPPWLHPADRRGTQQIKISILRRGWHLGEMLANFTDNKRGQVLVTNSRVQGAGG